MMKKAISALLSLALCMTPVTGAALTGTAETFGSTFSAVDEDEIIALTSAEAGEDYPFKNNNSFSLLLFDSDTGDVVTAEGIKLRVDYVDGSSFVVDYPGTRLWINKRDMSGTVSIESVPDGMEIPTNSLPAIFWKYSGSGEVLVKTNLGASKIKHCEYCGAELPEGWLTTSLGVWACMDCQLDGMGVFMRDTTTTTATTTTTTTTTTVVIDYATAFDFDDSPMRIGESRKIRYYNAGTKETGNGISIYPSNDNITYKWYEGNDFFIVTAVKAGDVSIEVNQAGAYLGGELQLTVLDENYVSDSKIVFDDETLSIGGNDTKEFKYSLSGADKAVFNTNDIYHITLDNNSKNGTLTVTSQHCSSGMNTIICELKKGSKTACVVEIPLEIMFKCPNCGKLVHDEDVAKTASGHDVCIDCYNSGVYVGTTTSTATTTTTTTTTTVIYDHHPVVEYDDSPMKIGETRKVKVYGSDKTVKGKIRSIDFNPKVVECTYNKGDDFFTMTAVAAVGYTDIWVYESSCTFSGDVGITILDEQYVPSDNTTTTTTTETTALIDPDYDFPIDVYIKYDVVIAIDDNAIIFKNNGRYGIQDTSRSDLSDVKAGMRISCHFSYMYSPDPPVILYVIEKEIIESKAEIEPTMAGDVNCDDQVNMADAVLIMQSVSNPDKYGIGLTTGINCVGAKNADVDGSGDVTNNDALKIQRFKLKMIDSLE